MMEEASTSISQSSNENPKTADSSKIDNIDPLMCFECAEVFDSAEELKKHVQTHLASMYGKDTPSREKNQSPFDVNSYNQMFNDSKNSASDDSKSGNSYFDTYMKARGLDTPSFGGLKRERESTKSPAMQQKQVTITVTSTTGDGRELKFICPICGKTCPSTEELGSHMESHSSQNGNESTDTSFSQNQNEMDTSFYSEVYKGMQKLQGAFTMGDNNNTDEGKGQEVSIKQEEVTGQSALIKEENNMKCENETNGLESSKGQSLSIVIKRDPDGYSISH
ncbi:unnamed protein product [Mytilus coruscus]|uniref:C2H2-type domain-containing protein n=1 Tax=Mytilus coruscus TaxID=42192 RepID=A0A6J8DAQ1_MYTCO|nr:unnamed protein product [Mytilus coruscus]